MRMCVIIQLGKQILIQRPWTYPCKPVFLYDLECYTNIMEDKGISYGDDMDTFWIYLYIIVYKLDLETDVGDNHGWLDNENTRF